MSFVRIGCAMPAIAALADCATRLSQDLRPFLSPSRKLARADSVHPRSCPSKRPSAISVVSNASTMRSTTGSGWTRSHRDRCHFSLADSPYRDNKKDLHGNGPTANENAAIEGIRSLRHSTVGTDWFEPQLYSSNISGAYYRMNSSRSALITSLCVVGMPCGKLG
jgi:hypothetical protein